MLGARGVELFILLRLASTRGRKNLLASRRALASGSLTGLLGDYSARIEKEGPYIGPYRAHFASFYILASLPAISSTIAL